MIKIYLEFCQKYGLTALNPSVFTIMCYIEYLANRLKSPKSVANYWSAVKLLHNINRTEMENAEDIQVKLMFRALTITKRHVSFQKLPLLKSELQQMCQILDKFPVQGITIKTALLIGYYGFLRASNLCREGGQIFDRTRHFTRADVQVTPQGLIVKLKWAKNMQDGLQPHHIRIPKVEPEYADPVASFIKMCRIVPANNNSPLFMLNPLQPLFVEQLRKTFKALCQEIGLDVQSLSLHSLRRGGASEAYTKGPPPLTYRDTGGGILQLSGITSIPASLPLTPSARPCPVDPLTL